MKVKKQGWTCVLLNGKQFLLQSAPVVLKDTNIVWYGNSFEQNMWNKNQLIDPNTWSVVQSKESEWSLYIVLQGVSILPLSTILFLTGIFLYLDFKFNEGTCIFCL